MTRSSRFMACLGVTCALFGATLTATEIVDGNNYECLNQQLRCSAASMVCDPASLACTWCDGVGNDPIVMSACVPKLNANCIAAATTTCGTQWLGRCSPLGVCGGKNENLGGNCPIGTGC